MVTLKNGKSVKMSELETGDKVQTGRSTGLNLVKFSHNILSFKLLVHSLKSIRFCRFV